MIAECQSQEHGSDDDSKSMEVCIHMWIDFFEIGEIRKKRKLLLDCVTWNLYKFWHFNCADQCSFFTTNIENGRAEITSWKMYARMCWRKTRFCKLNEIYWNRIRNLLITHCLIYCVAITDAKGKSDCRTHHILFGTAFWFQSLIWCNEKDDQRMRWQV